LAAEFRKNNEETRLEGVRCDETTAKKGHHLTAMTKKGRQFFSGKIGVPPRVTPTLVTPLTLRLVLYLLCE